VWSLIFRNLFFTILQPGIVTGLIPYLILGGPEPEVFEKTPGPFQIIAIIIFLAGVVILLYCISMFAVKGRGTLSPADPTKKLVISGLYKYSRNPMYIGVMLILIGESLFFSSIPLWIYSVFIFLAFNLFIVLHEEPRLENDFGAEYQQYKKSVRRWL
jgi:protein-S-isoprenylcysteine O-methyltransferase Ste14